MTTTPRTDAAIIAADGRWTYELKEEMQAMERELNAAKKRIAFLEEAVEGAARGHEFLIGFCQRDIEVLRKAKDGKP